MYFITCIPARYREMLDDIRLRLDLLEGQTLHTTERAVDITIELEPAEDDNCDDISRTCACVRSYINGYLAGYEKGMVKGRLFEL